jgi:hypothetical protein
MVISALGLADPSDPRYQNDKGLLNADLREDARRQLVEKALALYVEQGSLQATTRWCATSCSSRSGDFIQAVLEEQPPQLGKDGLMSLATRATVRVRDLQKSLNQMSREERVEFIRNNGDPKISVAITAKSAEGDPAAPAQRSPVAENLLKERIQSFGFRLWNDDMAKDGKGGADFVVTGEAKFRKLSAKLAASGITVEKFVLTSWTVKATDKKSGEEIYYNTQIPEKTSWATEDEALRDIGKLIGEEFSKGFFLSHFHFSGQKVRLKLQGLPNKDTAQLLMRELNGLRGVLAASLAARRRGLRPGALRRPGQSRRTGAGRDPASRSTTSSASSASTSAPAAAARSPSCWSRLQGARRPVAARHLPPAALIEAPPSRREAVVKNPETLKGSPCRKGPASGPFHVSGGLQPIPNSTTSPSVVGVAEADAALAAQDDFLALEGELHLAFEGDVGAVGALVDQHELVAPPLDAGMGARSAAVVDDDVAGGIAAKREGAVAGVELLLLAAMPQGEARGERRPPRRWRTSW